MTAWHTRIAPSPSGFFHLGTARTAYFCWLAARASGGTFLLRIDDTNATKSDPAFVDVIYRAMAYLGLDHDRSFAQSSRADRYRQVAQQLLDRGRARVQDGAIVLVPGHIPVTYDDVAMGRLRLSAHDRDFIDGMVLIRSDGAATYHLATVVDDIDCGINYILRGNDHATNTFKHLAIYAALAAPAPRYAHLGLLFDAATGKKLSKRDGAKSLLDYQADGIDPDAMLNFLLRLGWGPKVDDKSTATLPRDRALQLFLDGGNLRGQPAKADFAKLASFDRKYKARRG